MTARPGYLPPMPVQVWSPFMRRPVYVTEREAQLLTFVANSRPSKAERRAKRKREQVRHPGRKRQQGIDLGPPEQLSPEMREALGIDDSGWQGSQRRLAMLSGYSRAGLAGALATMRKLGILGVMTRRGRLGFTRLKLQAGVKRLLNARHVDGEDVGVIDSVSKSASISGNEGQIRPAGTSRFLKIDPWQPA